MEYFSMRKVFITPSFELDFKKRKKMKRFERIDCGRNGNPSTRSMRQQVRKTTKEPKKGKWRTSEQIQDEKRGCDILAVSPGIS